jgi:hypothetical protein
MNIDQETIKKARQTDLPSFLKSKGEPLKKSGKRYQHRDHDSLIISGHMFFWNSRQAKGNSLDFVRLFYGWSFEQAIEELTDDKGKTTLKPELPQEEEPKDLHISQAPDNKRVIAYLCQTRKIKYDLVKRLIDTHYLSQDEHNNAVFKIYNEKRELVGAELVGTLSTVRFKRIAQGTQAGYGFNITIGNPEKTLFFESPIDLLSFWSLNESKLTAHRLVSLGGLRVDIFQNTLERFSIDPITAYLCVDNDQAGKAFIQTIQSKYTNIKVHIPKLVKDWNDQLRNL